MSADEASSLPHTSLSSFSPEDNLGFLVNEVYTPWIKEHVIFSLVVDGMPCMREVAVDIIAKEEKGDKRGAAAIFFEHLKTTDDPGKYQSFVDALRQAKYPMIVDALVNHDVDPSLPESSQLIQLLQSDIADTIDPFIISQVLQQEEIITAEEGDCIRNIASQKSNRDANYKLLTTIPHRNNQWYKVFLKQLLENGYRRLVETIDPKIYALACKSSEDSDTDTREEEDHPSLDSVRDSEMSSASLSEISSNPEKSSASLPVPPVSNVQEVQVTVQHPVSPDLNGTDNVGLTDIIRELRQLKQMQQQQLDILSQLDSKVTVLTARVDGLTTTVQNIQAVGNSHK